MLASLSDNQRLQVQWFCDLDGQRELLRYNDEAKHAANTWTRRARNERFARQWRAMTNRKRRQRLILDVSRGIGTSPSFSAPRSGSWHALASGRKTLGRDQSAACNSRKRPAVARMAEGAAARH